MQTKNDWPKQRMIGLSNGARTCSIHAYICIRVCTRCIFIFSPSPFPFLSHKHLSLTHKHTHTLSLTGTGGVQICEEQLQVSECGGGGILRVCMRVFVGISFPVELQMCCRDVRVCVALRISACGCAHAPARCMFHIFLSAYVRACLCVLICACVCVRACLQCCSGVRVIQNGNTPDSTHKVVGTGKSMNLCYILQVHKSRNCRGRRRKTRYSYSGSSDAA